MLIEISEHFTVEDLTQALKQVAAHTAQLEDLSRRVSSLEYELKTKHALKNRSATYGCEGLL